MRAPGGIRTRDLPVSGVGHAPNEKLYAFFRDVCRRRLKEVDEGKKVVENLVDEVLRFFESG